jgi:DNA-directed RNA polymerase beta' subunit
MYKLKFYYEAMERLTLEELYYLGYADMITDGEYRLRAHPKALIIRGVPVMALCARAPVDGNNESAGFHPITKAYNKLVDVCVRLHAAKSHLKGLKQAKKGGEAISDEFIAKSKQIKLQAINQVNLVIQENYQTIQKAILSAKGSGLMRGESQGKVTSHLGRTVVIPDPRNRAGEISIPAKAAAKITTRVTVTPANIFELTEKMRNGKVKYIHPHTSIIQGSSIQVTPANRKSLVLQVGDEVSRDIEVGDYLLFIRQPVISGLSLVSNRVVRVWDNLAFGFSLEEVEIRAMDFDGDQAQGLSPQSESAMAELRSINSAEQLLIDPKNQSLVFGIHQDGILGCVTLTTNPINPTKPITDANSYVSRSLFDRITALVSDKCKSYISEEGKRMGITDKMEDFQRRLARWGKTLYYNHNGGEVVSGEVLLSWAFPPGTQYTTKTLEIRDGIVVRGVVDKTTLGRAQDTLLHFIAETDRDMALTVMKDATIIATSFISFYGMSAGWKDCAPVKEETQRAIGAELTKMMVELNRVEDPLDAKDARRYNDELQAVISRHSGTIDELVLGGLEKDNRIMKIIDSGAKGTKKHLYNIAGIVGQQYIAGRLPSKVMTGGTRYSWYWDSDDREPTSMGMCTSSLSLGYTPAELIHVAAAARMSFINLHITTPDIGSKLNDMNRVLAGVITNGTGACTDNNRVVSSLYGGDGFAPDRLSRIRQPTGGLELRFAHIGSFVESMMAEEGWYRTQ